MLIMNIISSANFTLVTLDSSILEGGNDAFNAYCLWTFIYQELSNDVWITQQNWFLYICIHCKMLELVYTTAALERI